MQNFLKASDADSLAVHAMALLAVNDGRLLRIKDIAEMFGISHAHLAKVLNRLVRAGLVAASRGPMGGYRLKRPAHTITLREIYTAIEGDSGGSGCMFTVPRCNGTGCMLGDFFTEQSKQIDEKLGRTRLSDIHLRPGVFPNLSQT